MPCSIAASTTAFVPASSTLRPKLLQPSPTTETTRPELPSLRYRMSAMPLTLLCLSKAPGLCLPRLATADLPSPRAGTVRRPVRSRRLGKHRYARGVTTQSEIDGILARAADGGRISDEEALLLYTDAPFHPL